MAKFRVGADPRLTVNRLIKREDVLRDAGTQVVASYELMKALRLSDAPNLPRSLLLTGFEPSRSDKPPAIQTRVSGRRILRCSTPPPMQEEDRKPQAH